MDTTSSTLLGRLKDRRDSSAWCEFDRIYSRLLYRYARARGLSRADAEDAAQQCMAVVVRHISGFRYDKAKGGFKCWLRTMMENKTTDLYRRRRPAQARTRDLDRPDAARAGPEELWDREWDRQHFKYCLDKLRTQVSEDHYRAFRLYAIEEKPAAEVAGLLEMSANQVRLIKSRMLVRLRGLAKDLFGDVED